MYSRASAWTVHKSLTCAGDDALFDEVAQCGSGEVLVAHVRQRTVGSLGIANTHPFRRGPWVFAHNGTIENTDFLRRRTSAQRAREIEGETDSEVLFAYLLSCLDTAAPAEGNERADRGMTRAVGEIRGAAQTGSFNFLMSNGHAMYAYRQGRPLYVVERRRDAGTTTAILFASEPLTDEPWRALAERSLLCADRRDGLGWRVLAGATAANLSVPESRPELPFTD